MATNLTIKKLKSIYKKQNLSEEFCKTLINITNEFDIKDEELCRFLAHTVHEMQIYKNGNIRLRENFNYSVRGIMAVSYYFRRNKKLAEKYGRRKGQKANQEMIANIFYNDANRGSRFKLGNINEGDGWRFRGAGIIQSTGRANITKDIDFIHSNTTYVIADKDYNINDNYISFILIGIAFWRRNSLKDKSTFQETTNFINSGLNRKKKRERERTYVRIKRYLNT